MKTRVTIMIEHDKPIEGLGAKIAARAWTLQGVNKAELESETEPLNLDPTPISGWGQQPIGMSTKDPDQ